MGVSELGRCVLMAILAATAVIMSITSAAPFNGTEDSDLAVAYIAVFILVFYASSPLSQSARS